MSPKTKAILKTTGAVLVGAAAFAYLPLVSFAVAPQVMGWAHLGLAAVHPMLGEGLLATGCLAGMGLSIKKTWARYFTEKKLEKKIEQIVTQKLAHRQHEDRVQQQENTKQAQRQHTHERSENTKTKEQRENKAHPVKRADLRLTKNTLRILRNRKQQRDAA